MNKKHEALISILKKEQHPMTSLELANSLHVTTRTIKNYVTTINSEVPGCILSSSQGYSFNKHSSFYSKNNHKIPQTQEERFSYIIHLFFIEHTKSKDIYDLADELFVSYSSLRQLLSKINKNLRPYQVSLRCKNDLITVVGKEEHWRKFISSIIYKESKGKFIDLSVLDEIFPKLDIKKIHTILHSTFKKHEYYINDFGYTNLMLHLAIILDRVQNGSFLETLEREQSSRISDISNEIIASLQEALDIQLNPIEKLAINELINANLNMCTTNSVDQLIETVGKKTYQVTLYIINELNKEYDLHLNPDSLLYPLALHFKNLLHRNEQQIFLSNPLLETIETSCPTLFDCAIFISNILYNKLNVRIAKDEIAYLAMHIGADIERQDKASDKLKCVLICPDYQNNREQIHNYLLFHFSNQIEIVNSYTFESNFDEADIDIIFSTIPLTNPCHANYILIPPFKSSIDLKYIFNYIQNIIDQKKLGVLATNFATFFHPAMFLYMNDGEKIEVIKKLTNLLIQNKFVNHNFYQDVLKREEAASTAFGKIAIPHSIQMNAKHTGIALAISPNGVIWNEQKVNIVLLIAINEKESYLFKDLYEALILLFSEPSFLKQTSKCQTFDAFKSLIYQYIPVKEL